MATIRGWHIDVNVDRYDIGTSPRRDGETVPAIESWHRAQNGAVELWFQTAVGPDARLTCTSLDIRSETPLSTSSLKKIPISAILEYLSLYDLTGIDAGPPMDKRTGLRRFHYSDAELAKLDQRNLRDAYLANAEPAPVDPRPRRGGQGPGRTELEKFAAAYQVALKTRPRGTIAETVELLKASGFKISPATAHRWRKLCRETDPPLLNAEPGATE